MAYTTAQLLGALLTVDGRATEGGIVDIPPGARLLLDVISEGQADGDFLNDLEVAVAEAKAARDEAQVISGLTGEDNAVAALLGNPASATSAAASATIAAQRDLISSMVEPVFLAHRGGEWLYPENSIDSQLACLSNGHAFEPDLQMTSDGVPVCHHDETLDRTHFATGTLASTTHETFMKSPLRPVLAGGRHSLPVDWATCLDTVGGRVLIFPEIKMFASTGGIPAATAAAGVYAEMVVQRGLQRAVIFTSFNLESLVSVFDRGCAGMWVQPNGLNTSQINAYKADYNGVYVGVSPSCTQATVQAMAAAGLKVFVYSLTTPAQVATWRSWGAVGFWCADPLWMSGKVARRYARPSTLRERRPWPNMGLDTSGVRGTARFYETATGTSLQVAGNGFPNHVRLGDTHAMTRNGGAVEFTMRHLAGSTNASDSVRVGLSMEDRPLIEGGGSPDHYLLLFRRGGACDQWSITGNVATALTTTGDADPLSTVVASGAEGPDERIRIELTATTLVIKNLTTAKTQTITNSAFAGPFYLNMGTNYASGSAGAIFDPIVTAGT